MAAAGAALVTALTGCGDGRSTSQSGLQINRQAAEKLSDPTPTPSPNGDYIGSCDYTLPAGMSDDYKVIGTVEATNTGNIGIETKLTVKWHQMGYDPVTMTKTVKLKPGQHKTVQFHKEISGTTLDRIQSWQSNHALDEACSYNGSIVNTFGSLRR